MDANRIGVRLRIAEVGLNGRTAGIDGLAAAGIDGGEGQRAALLRALLLFLALLGVLLRDLLLVLLR